MYRRFLVLGLALFLVGTASADLDNWKVKVGLSAKPFGYLYTRFGVDPDAKWDYDGRDAVHPPFNPEGELAIVFTDGYYTVFRDEIPHDAGGLHWDAPIGWPPPWKPWIPPDQYPDYPNPGLLVDVREPITCPGQVDFWMMWLNVPSIAETFTFFWDLCEPGFEPPPNVDIRVWGNEDLEGAGWYGDLVLTDPIWGGNGGINDIPNPPGSTHLWIIQATVVPEPGAVELAGLMVALGGVGLARVRRR